MVRLTTALLVCAFLPACGSGASTTPAVGLEGAGVPSPPAMSQPPISSPAHASPVASATPQPDGLEAPDILTPLSPETLATVVTSDLVVRSLPEISDESVIHPVLLQAGEDLYVIEGPQYADGYAWYHVAPVGQQPGNDVAPAEPLPRIGWVASGTPADPWVLPWAGECPPADIEEIWRERPLVLLACFGSEELTLQGARGECGYTVPGYVRPLWLNHEWCELMPFDLPSDAFSLGRATLHFHQDAAAPLLSEDRQTPVRVVGHFDDPAARTCAVDPTAPIEEPAPPELVILLCRARFVATEVTEIERP